MSAGEQRIPRSQLLVLFVLVVVGLAVVFGRSFLESYFSSSITAPEVAAEASVLDPGRPPETRLAVAGDVGTGGSIEYRTATVAATREEAQEFDALLLLGDNVYENGDPSDVGRTVLDPFDQVLDGGTDLVAVLGNHDIRDGNGPAQAEALGMPERWYETRFGDARIIALDSNQPEDSDQLRWLETALQDRTPEWTIVIMHHPAYSAGWHGSERSVQTNFVPLFEEYGVDLVLSGHDHDYQRSKPINGVTYVVTGAAAKLRETGAEDFTAVSWSTYSFVELNVYPGRLEGVAIDHDGRAIDSFTLSAAG